MPEDEAFSPAEIELTVFAIDAWQTGLGECRKSDCANALNAAVAFLSIFRALLAEGSSRTAISVLNQARTVSGRAGLRLEAYDGLEAGLLRERLVDIEGEMRLAWESVEAALKFVIASRSDVSARRLLCRIRFGPYNSVRDSVRRPGARNPRKNDAAVDRMCASIREFGFRIRALQHVNFSP